MKTSLWLLTGLISYAAGSLRAQDFVAATPPAGYFKLPVRGASDTGLSLPLVKQSALLDRITAVGAHTITLARTGVTTSYAPGSGATYYAQFISGDLAGLCFDVVSNDSNVFTLATGTEDLTSHPLGAVAAGDNGDVIRIRPHWTLADVFGADESSLRLAPVSDLTGVPYVESDAVLLPDNTVTGTEKKPRAAVSFVSGTGWRQRGNPDADQASAILPPAVPFVVRRHHAATETLVVGYVPSERFLLRLPALAAGEERDVAVAWPQPISRRLADSGLSSSDAGAGVVEPSPDGLSLRDLLLEFDSVRLGLALPAAHRFYYVAGTGWIEAGAAADDHLLKAGAGYVLRLRGERPARYWVQPPN